MGSLIFRGVRVRMRRLDDGQDSIHAGMRCATRRLNLNLVNNWRDGRRVSTPRTRSRAGLGSRHSN